MGGSSETKTKVGQDAVGALASQASKVTAEDRLDEAYRTWLANREKVRVPIGFYEAFKAGRDYAQDGIREYQRTMTADTPAAWNTCNRILLFLEGDRPPSETTQTDYEYCDHCDGVACIHIVDALRARLATQECPARGPQGAAGIARESTPGDSSGAGAPASISSPAVRKEVRPGESALEIAYQALKLLRPSDDDDSKHATAVRIALSMAEAELSRPVTSEGDK